MLALRPMGETLIMPFLYMYSELAFVRVAALSVSLLLLLLAGIASSTILDITLPIERNCYDRTMPKHT